MFEIPATNELSLRGSRHDDHVAKRSCYEDIRGSVSIRIPRPKAAESGSSAIPGDIPSAVCTYVKELRKI